MKKTTILSFFLLLMNCATAISQELMCRHYDVSAGKNTKYAWFELRLDEVQTDKNFILWHRELDVESGKQGEPNLNFLRFIFHLEKYLLNHGNGGDK